MAAIGNANSNSSTESKTSTENASPRTVTAPWTQILSIAAASSSPASFSSPSTAVVDQSAPALEDCVENEIDSNGNGGKKQVWSRPSNGASDVGSVMGGQWPALSESARVSSKPSSDASKVLSEGSPSSPVVSQGTGNAFASSQKPISDSAFSNSTPTPNHSVPARQRSFKRSNSGSSSNGAPSQPLTPGSVVEAPLQSPSSRDHAQRGGVLSQSQSGNDHPQHRNSFRNRGGGSHPRGDGSHPRGDSSHSRGDGSHPRGDGSHPRGDGSHAQNYGGRRNQDHGNQDFHQRSFRGRDVNMQPQRGVPGFNRHTTTAIHNPPTYMTSPPARPFGASLVYPEYSAPVIYLPTQGHPDPMRAVPFLAPMPPVFFSQVDPLLHANIVNQIDYYFSNENLVKDTFLRQNMDEQGWVPITLIAGFKKVSILTNDIQLILDVMRSSTVVEVQGDKIRKRNDWTRWIMQPSTQYSNLPSPQSVENSSHDFLTAGIQNISLDQSAANRNGPRNGENVHESSRGRPSSMNEAQ